MKFGIQHGMGHPLWKPEILEPHHVISFATAVEDAGFTHLAFTDHPSPSKSWVDSGGEGVVELFTALGFCAAVTTRIKLLTWLLVIPYHNPFATAHRIASLDALSSGRAVIGMGTGYLKSEFAALGIDFDGRRETFDENDSIMREALSGGPVTHEGRSFSSRGIVVEPPVVQSPHPPLWIHANGDWGTRRAARYAQGWVGLLTKEQTVRTIRTRGLYDFADVARQLDTLRIELDKNERTIDDIEIVMTSIVPHLDERTGWNVQEYSERFAQLEELGVDTIIVNAIGNDARLSESSALKFADDFIN